MADLTQYDKRPATIDFPDVKSNITTLCEDIIVMTPNITFGKNWTWMIACI